MIPKIIHYCWFGKKEKPATVRKTIDSWQFHLPEYQLKEWNEENFPIDTYLYAQQAYEKGKMAFVSDVARVAALSKYGGVYLDTDIEIKKDFSELLLNKKVVLGFENSGRHVMTAFMASERQHPLWSELLAEYQTKSFVKSNEELDMTPNTHIITSLLLTKELQLKNEIQQLSQDIWVYPENYFSAYNFKYMEDISDFNTFTIHHCNATWMPPKNRFRFFVKRNLIRVLGNTNYRKFYTMFVRDGK